MTKISVILIGVIVVAGCKNLAPQSHGELSSGYTYIPIDPFSVQTVRGDSCRLVDVYASSASPLMEDRQLRGGVPVYKDIMDSLPDNAVRMLIEQFDSNGNVSYGAGKLGSKYESYQITVDYISADTVNQEFWISKTMLGAEDGRSTGRRVLVSLSESPSPRNYIPGSEEFKVKSTKPPEHELLDYVKYNVPVYVGIGLRAIANVRVLESKANISGISVIGAEAEAKRLSGTLIVQTLGVNGKAIAGALPIQSELNSTTAQNAIVSIASIKALLYASDVEKNPRVVGLYLPFPGGKPLVNAIISELSQQRVRWSRPCKWVDRNTRADLL